MGRIELVALIEMLANLVNGFKMIYFSVRQENKTKSSLIRELVEKVKQYFEVGLLAVIRLKSRSKVRIWLQRNSSAKLSQCF